MASRSCPLCFVKLPRASVLARSDELICPSCHSALELSRTSRVTAALLGLLVAYLAAQLTVSTFHGTAWVLGVVAAVLGYGLGSALFLFSFSDLVVRPKPSASFPQIHG